MSIKELDKILKKDPIITTFGACDLINNSKMVMAEYKIHANTHLSLGDTASYVDKIFKWVSGENQGTFIGAVLGDYGEGKTSFQIHIWEQSFTRKVLAVPPFQWSKFEDIVDAIAGWVKFILEPDRPDLVIEVTHQYNGFKANTVENLTRELASKNNIDYEDAYKIISAGLDSGAFQLSGFSASRVLDFLEILSKIIAKAGYLGILVLLDEPEVAARHLGNEVVQGFIFDLADLLHQRQGNYGVFLSMPQTFYASCNNKFQSLPARLQSRQCFPRLGDIYGPDFAGDLWNRYIEKFELGQEGLKVVEPWALKAIGQIGSTDCRHLGYGPRTVVSAFNSMVAKYVNKSASYNAADLLIDIKHQEIMTQPEYRTSLNNIINSQDITDENKEAVEFLSVFPSGLKIEELKQLGYETLLRPLSIGNGLIQITAHTMVLRQLKPAGTPQGDILEEMIHEYDDGFAPGLIAKKNAIKAFVDVIIPEIFPKKRAGAINGWSDEETIRNVGSGILYFGVKVGSFDEMSKTFPLRAVMIAVGSPEAGFSNISIPKLNQETGPVSYDLLYKIVLHSGVLSEDEVHNHVDIRMPNNNRKIIEFDINLDLINQTIPHEYLGNIVGAERLSPLWLLGLINKLVVQKFPMEYQNIWDVMQQEIIRELKKSFFGMNFSEKLKDVLSTNFQINLSEAGVGLIDKASAAMLFKKYPNYSTLIRQPQWSPKIADYVAALESASIPLECKRGKKVWKATSQELEKAFHTSIMNISGGAFDNFDNLLKIKSFGKDQPREVQFFIHPFEQEIANFINSDENDDRIKVDNIDCPCMSIRVQLLDWLKKYGYTVDELKNIINIGIARKTFEKEDRHGEEILYCRPLDLAGLKENLKDKLEAFKAEVMQMQKISWYKLNFDFEEAYEDIEKILTDTDYDAENRMIDAKRADHIAQVTLVSSIYPDEIDTNIVIPLANSKKGLDGDRRILSLRTLEAKSAWVSNLNEYIVPNFQQRISKIRSAYDDIQRQSEQLKGKLSAIETISRNEVISQLVACYEEYVLLKSQWETEVEEVTHLFVDLKYFDEWLKFKNESDTLYVNILELKNIETHKEMAEELLGDFSNASSVIEDHLRLTNIDGLKDCQRFRQSLLDIDKKRDDYLSRLRVEFNNQKNKINELFQSLNLEPLKNVFDQSNTKQSYDFLYKDAIEKLRRDCFDAIRNELYLRQMDILYASNILNTIEPEKAEELLKQKDAIEIELSEIEKQLSKNWLLEILTTENPELIAVVKNAYKQSDEYFHIIMNATRPKELTERKLIELNKEIEQKDEVDLKDLILYVSKRVEKPQQALDETLTSLSELFKSNTVEIKVKYRKR